MSRVAETIMVVEDEPNIGALVRTYLERAGYRALWVRSGEDALTELRRHPVRLVVLDIGLPGIDGFEVCRRIAGEVPVIMLTARDEEPDRVAGLEVGADDYVAKPFSPRELTARVKAVLRRAAGGLAAEEAGVLRAGDLEVDPVAHEARLHGELVSLTAREFDLLAHLMCNPRRAFRREELLADVWGFTYGDTSTVTVHVRRLREKVEADPSAPSHICTVWGVGYRFEP